MYKNYDLHDIINGNKSKSNLHLTAKKTIKLLNPRAIWLKDFFTDFLHCRKFRLTLKYILNASGVSYYSKQLDVKHVE